MNPLTDEQIREVYDGCVSCLSDPDKDRGLFELMCDLEGDLAPEKVFIQLIDKLRATKRDLIDGVELLKLLYDKYEDGNPCYDKPNYHSQSQYLGNAVHLNDIEEKTIINFIEDHENE
jgi:hypothetical protein